MGEALATSRTRGKTSGPCFVKGSGGYGSIYTVERLYKERDARTAIILGSGPSLKNFDFSQLDRTRFYVIGINDELIRNRDKFQLGMWMLYDAGVINRHRNTEIHKDTLIATRKPLVHSLVLLRH